MKTAYSILDLAVVSKGNNIKKTIENSIQLAQKYPLLVCRAPQYGCYCQ